MMDAAPDGRSVPVFTSIRRDLWQMDGRKTKSFRFLLYVSAIWQAAFSVLAQQKEREGRICRNLLVCFECLSHRLVINMKQMFTIFD